MDREIIEKSDALLNDAIRQRLDEVWPDHAPHMVTNWMVGAVAIGGDGAPIIYDMTPMTCAPWDKLAILEHIRMRTQAKITVEEQCAHDRGEGEHGL